MSRLFKTFFVAAALLAMVWTAKAFSLLGPFESWQVPALGYQLAGDIGGPMNLGEEYRWDTPELIYAYDSSFIEFFGQKGIDAIEQAIGILNALPSASQMSRDLREFPIDARHFNFQASALGLIDLKSYTLSTLLEGMGLASPERYAWTLRFIPPATPFITIRRNFDPVLLHPTPYVNGTLYTYQIIQYLPGLFDAREVVVDPFVPSVSAVVSLTDSQGFSDRRGVQTTFSPGLFYTGITRDDAGGLRYLLSQNNLNVETLPFTIRSAGGAPWSPAGSLGSTNQGLTTPTNVVLTALRPGVEKIHFRRANFDSGVGNFFTNVVAFNDVVISNGVPRLQSLRRVLVAPDIIFDAADLGQLSINRTVQFSSSNIVGGAAGGGTGNTNILAGPGVISGVRITFSKILPFFSNIGPDNQAAASISVSWGSFDGTTNAPVVFPEGASIQDIERRILNATKPNPWRLPP